MNERLTGPRRSLLTTFALVALSAGPALAQPSPPNDEKAGEAAPPASDVAKPVEIAPPPSALPPPPEAPAPANGNGNGKRGATEEIPRPPETPTPGLAPGETTFARTPLKV